MKKWACDGSGNREPLVPQGREANREFDARRQADHAEAPM